MMMLMFLSGSFVLGMFFPINILKYDLNTPIMSMVLISLLKITQIFLRGHKVKHVRVALS